MSITGRTLVGGGRDFRYHFLRRFFSRTMAIKPGRSSKLEAVIGFDDCGGSTNSPLGAERFWIERFSMVKEKDKIRGKGKSNNTRAN